MKNLYDKHWNKLLYGGLIAILGFDAIVIYIQPIMEMDGKQTNMTEPILMLTMVFCFVFAVIGIGALVTSAEKDDRKKKAMKRDLRMIDLNEIVSEQRSPMMVSLNHPQEIIRLRGDNDSFRSIQSN